MRFNREVSRRGMGPAFSLVELLVVISIVGLLAGLSSVAIPKAMEAGKKAKAKGDLAAIVTAVKAYRQEYGRWPVAIPNGIDDEDTEGGGTYSWFSDTRSKELMMILSASPRDQSGLNPKKVRFLEGAAEDGSFEDPWKNQYIVKLDTNESNSIEYYGPANKPNINQTVIALSLGPPVAGQFQQLDPDSSNCKNIFSWR